MALASFHKGITLPLLVVATLCFGGAGIIRAWQSSYKQENDNQIQHAYDVYLRESTFRYHTERLRDRLVSTNDFYNPLEKGALYLHSLSVERFNVAEKSFMDMPITNATISSWQPSKRDYNPLARELQLVGAVSAFYGFLLGVGHELFQRKIKPQD